MIIDHVLVADQNTDEGMRTVADVKALGVDALFVMTERHGRKVQILR